MANQMQGLVGFNSLNPYQRTAEGYLGASGDILKNITQGYGTARGLYDPAYNRMVGLSEDKGQSLADKASTDTRLAFAKSRAMKERELSRMGVNPNSGRFAGLISEENLAQAAAEAGNMTRARAAGAANAGQAAYGLANMAGSQLSSAAANIPAYSAAYRTLAGEYGSLASAQEQERKTRQNEFQAQQNQRRTYQDQLQAALQAEAGQRYATMDKKTAEVMNASKMRGLIGPSTQQYQIPSSFFK
jgi:hypothetical protein